MKTVYWFPLLVLLCLLGLTTACGENATPTPAASPTPAMRPDRTATRVTSPSAPPTRTLPPSPTAPAQPMAPPTLVPRTQESTPTPTPGPTGSGAPFIRKADEAMQDLTRFRFRTVLTGSTAITVTEGAEFGTSMLIMTETVRTGKHQTQHQEVEIGGSSWENFGGGWIEQPYVSAEERLFTLTLADIVRFSLDSIEVADDLGDTTLDGVGARHLRITTNADSIGRVATGEVWIDRATSYVAQIQLEPVVAQEAGLQGIAIKMWQFNDPPSTIEGPLIDARAITPIALPPRGQRSDLNLNGISMVSPGEGWAVGRQGPQPVLLHYTRGRWILTPAPTYLWLAGVCMTAATDGWAVGEDMRILHYQRGQWTRVDSPAAKTHPESALISVTMTSPHDGWAVGMDGLILHYARGAWTEVPSPTKAALYGVSMVSPDEGWAVGQESSMDVSGVVLHYHAGKWTQEPKISRDSLRGISMISSDEGWAVGNQGTILHYIHGQWLHQDNVAGGDLWGLSMVSRDEGWVDGPRAVLHYQRGQWAAVAAPAHGELTAISMVSATEGWAVGEQGTILHYHNGVWSSY